MEEKEFQKFQEDVFKLQDFIRDHEIIYAITGTKRLIIRLYNAMEVWKLENNKWILYWQGIQPYAAVEAYTELP